MSEAIEAPNPVAQALADFQTGFTETCTQWFQGPFKAVFGLFDGPLGAIENRLVFAAAAMFLFIATMAWVLTLRKQYVNLDAPGPQWYYDLRVWTIVSMAPHVLIYWMFR